MKHDDETLAATLREIDHSLLKRPPDGLRRRWLQGAEPYFDVFFESDGRGLRWFQLTLRGRSVTWDRDLGTLRTGLTHEQDLVDTPHPASKVIEEDATLDLGFVERAARICGARDGDGHFERAHAVLRAELDG